MATKKKMLQAAAGNAGGAGGAALDVEDVFSTYLYTGNDSTQTITNGVDLDGEGGLVWIKNRSSSGTNHSIFDSESGATGGTRLRPNLSNGLQAFNGTAVFTTSSTGFALNNDASNDLNDSSYNYVSWTFRKAPKFFTCLTYTGSASASQTISHDLGAVPGFMVIKKTSGSGTWYARHRHDYDDFYMLNATDAASSYANLWASYDPTDVDFKVGTSDVNNNGDTYVAYLWAHNDGDGEFGPDADQDIIKCGSYTNSGSAWSVDLGFEPQFLIRKLADGTSDWQITDTMRGLYPKGQNAKNLRANTSNAENNAGGIQITPTGIEGTGNGATGTWIYIAIRRGPLAPPESATEVFAMDYQGNGTTDPAYVSGFVTDFGIRYYLPGGANAYPISGSRLTGTNRLTTRSTSAQVSQSSLTWDYMNGWYNPDSNSTNVFSHMWKRAPNYMDCVAYTGVASAQTLTHNLGVVPEMIWIKKRSEASYYGFVVYHGTTGNMYLANTFSSGYGGSNAVNHSTISDTTFEVRNGNGEANEPGETHIAYLFASLAGISKVGSVTHSGTTNVDCGFTSGARFVLLKRTDASGDWYIWDSTRGIVSGNDPYLLLNTTGAEVTNTDYIDQLSSGFTITSSLTAGDYMFYAIA